MAAAGCFEYKSSCRGVDRQTAIIKMAEVVRVMGCGKEGGSEHMMEAWVLALETHRGTECRLEVPLEPYSSKVTPVRKGSVLR